MKCKECIHFHEKEDKSKGLGKTVGDCLSKKLIDDGSLNPDNDGLAYADYEGYAAFLIVGGEFACIHFSQ